MLCLLHLLIPSCKVWFEAFPLVYDGIYHFNLGESGLPFLGLMVSCVLTSLAYIAWNYWYVEPYFRRMLADMAADAEAGGEKVEQEEEREKSNEKEKEKVDMEKGIDELDGAPEVKSGKGKAKARGMVPEDRLAVALFASMFIPGSLLIFGMPHHLSRRTRN
jgi:hypothetical protein